MMKLHCEMVSRYRQKDEPLTAAVPIPKGKLWESQLQNLVLMGEKEKCPCQSRVTGTWEDGSIKWLLLRFLADLPANRASDYYLMEEAENSSDRSWRNMDENIACWEGNQLIVDTGVMRAILSIAGDRYLFQRIETEEGIYNHDFACVPHMINEKGEIYQAVIGEDGWQIRENGSVCAVLQCKGRHVNQKGETWFDFQLRLTVWRGKPWLKFDYQFINTEEDKDGQVRDDPELNSEAAGFKYSREYAFEKVKGIEVSFCPDRADREFSHGLLTSGFHHTEEKKSDSNGLSHLISADTIIETANEMFPEVLFGIYAAEWREKERAFTTGIYQAYQNFPKGIKSSGEKVTLQLMPKEYGEMLKIPQGAARTSHFHLWFHPGGLSRERIIDRELLFQSPPVAVPEPSCYEESGVYGSMFSSRYCQEIERFLYRYVDSRAKGLGMMNFGDCPEWEYRKQGRSGGKDVWINNEYDMPHNFMIMYARTGDRRYLDYLRASTEHWYDVDFCHYSPNPDKRHLLYTHSAEHVTGQPVPSHQWVEGFWDYYHQTGDEEAKATALSIGESLLRLLELPLYRSTGTVEPREAGWAMRAFLALFEETHEERWLDACKPIVDVYLEWAKQYGSWTSPFPDNYLGRVPFMITVGVVGLNGYYRLRPEPKIREMILFVIDEMIRECYVERAGTFCGKQAPSVRYLNLNGMVLQSLSIAYELTGDRKYIDLGMGMFRWISVENPPPIYDFSKVRRDSFTVIYDCPAGPKRCAQTLLPFLHFYKYVMELNLIPCD